MIKEFIKNLKEYVDYLMKVNFKDLLINTIILICILLLAAFAYIPASILRDIIRSFITAFTSFNGVTSMLFECLFKIVGYGCCIWAFMYLFNKRFDDIKAFEEQVKGEEPKKVVVNKNKTKATEVEEIELPKAKSN